MALEIHQLSCVRGDRTLFEQLNFSLNYGELLFLEGKNGSGKTTLLRALCGLFLPEKGEIRWKKQNIRQLGESYWKALLYLGHLNGIKGDLTAVENLRINHRLHGHSDTDQPLLNALEKMGLYGYEDVPTRQLSQGQKRRVALSRLLLNKAPLWLLDEPFVALDKAAVSLLQAVIAKHIEQGGMAVLTTHQAVPLTEQQTRHLQLG